MENSVELRGLCRRFSGKVALDGLTFRMDGGVFGLLGGKGAGKSTLLRILATLLPGDGGEALVCGLPLARAGAVRAIVGYLPEDFSDLRRPARRARPWTIWARSRGWTRLTRRAAHGAAASSASASPRQAQTRVRRLERRHRCAAWAWRRRSSTTRACCCSTSRPPASRPRNAPACAPCLPRPPSTASWCSPPSARTMWRPSAPAWPCWTGANCAIWARRGSWWRALQGKVFLAELPEGALPDAAPPLSRGQRRFAHGRRRVARFLDPEGAPGLGRADRPGLRRRLSPLPERGRAGMSLFRLGVFARLPLGQLHRRGDGAGAHRLFPERLPARPRASSPPARKARRRAWRPARSRRRTTPSPAIVDRFSGAHARLFASRVGARAGRALRAFPGRGALLARPPRLPRRRLRAGRVLDAKLVLCRAAALTAAMALPVAVMALTLTSVAATDYGPANVDILAYGKYALFWLLPTIAALHGRRRCCPRR